ncbi:MAG: hypothetical protein AAF726_06705 [Planctomycetota bacterium]
MALGALLIALGLRLDGEAGAEERVGVARRDAATKVERSSDATTVVVRLAHRSDGTPAAGAQVGLWRRAYGEGVARRRARRIGEDVVADENGIARFLGRANEPLEVVARARGRGPVLREPLGLLQPGEHRELDLVVERPPAPLRIVVRSAAGEVVSGASIRGVADPRPGEAGEPLRRTNGQGRADLDGTVRAYRWIVVEAAGHGPAALSAGEIARRARPVGTEDRMEWITVSLDPEATVVARLAPDGGQPPSRFTLEGRFTLDGYSAGAVARSTYRGVATLSGLPANAVVELTVVDDRSGEPVARGVVELEPGEQLECVADSDGWLR